MSIDIRYTSKKIVQAKKLKQNKILMSVTLNSDILSGCDATVLSVDDPLFIHDVYMDDEIMKSYSGIKLSIDATGKHINLAVDKEGTPILIGSDIVFICHISGIKNSRKKMAK